MSVTTPTACEKSWVQAGVVLGATRIEPGDIFSKSACESTTLAGAVTVPELTANPFSVSLVGSFLIWVSLNLTVGMLLASAGIVPGG